MKTATDSEAVAGHDGLSPGRFEAWLLPVAALLSGLWMILNGWVADDAYITFRTIDNFVEGHGLRWNIAERVQVFTHPLWMLLHIPFYFVYRNIFLITLVISWTCTAGAVLCILRTFPRRPANAALFLLLPLALSKPLVDYAASGLENPLSFLLFALFGYHLRRPDAKYYWLWMSLLPALAMVNRLDTALIYGPITLYLVLRVRWRAKWGQIFVGALPLVAWELFSLVYYGFPFPNTKYAKLNTGVSSEASAEQGRLYLLELWHTDALSWILIGLGLAGAIYRSLPRGRAAEGRDVQTPWIVLALGVPAYIAYVVSVGGDFMSGRFFTMPIFVSVWLFYGTIGSPRSKAHYGYWVAFLLTLKLFSTISATDFRPLDEEFRATYGIADERRFHITTSAFYDPESGKFRTDVDPRSVVMREIDFRRRFGTDRPLVHKTIGGFGFNAKAPEWHIVDPFALAEPLLARLPIFNPEHWRIGHFERRLPDGYLHAVETGDTSQMQEDLAAYYEVLKRVVRGPLFSAQRFQDIVDLNLGRHDHLTAKYVESTRFDSWHQLLVIDNAGSEPVLARLRLHSAGSLGAGSLDAGSMDAGSLDAGSLTDESSETGGIEITVPGDGFVRYSEAELRAELGVPSPKALMVEVESDPSARLVSRWVGVPAEVREGDEPPGAVGLAPEPEAAPVTPPGADSELLFPYVSKFRHSMSHLTLRNPESEPVEVEITAWIRSRPLEEATRTVPAGGEWTESMEELFPDLEYMNGYAVRVRPLSMSDEALEGRWHNLNPKIPPSPPVGFGTATRLDGTQAAQPGERLLFGFLPAREVTSVVILTNLSDDTAVAQLRFTDADGRPVERASGDSEIEIPPMQSAPVPVPLFLHESGRNLRLEATCDTAPLLGWTLYLRSGYQPSLSDAVVLPLDR